MAGSTAFQRARGKPYAETFRCPGGALCLDFCNSGQSARGPSGAEWIAGFPELIDWLDAAMQPLVESAVSLLTSAKMERLRRCGNSTCYWLFIDETKNHSRRWCEMASCGNVVKVRRHREKARNAAH